MQTLKIIATAVSGLVIAAAMPLHAEPVAYAKLAQGKPDATAERAVAIAPKPSTSRKSKVRRHKATPVVRVAVANRTAIQEPKADGYFNAIQVYPFMEGAVYRLYATPGQVSDVKLEAAEQLIAISAGDTARWVIGDTTSGSGSGKQTHILIKPISVGLKTNLVVTTSKRTYHLLLESTAATAMVAISWSYPQDALLTLKASQVKDEAASQIASGINIDRLNFRYDIAGDKPRWRPVRVFDDGEKVYIEFPTNLAQGEAPPLFVVGDGGKSELVNYRVQGRYYVADRLFDVAELRLGGKRQAVVRLKKKTSWLSASSYSDTFGESHD